jgi:hypothetical protein
MSARRRHPKESTDITDRNARVIRPAGYTIRSWREWKEEVNQPIPVLRALDELEAIARRRLAELNGQRLQHAPVISLAAYRRRRGEGGAP